MLHPVTISVNFCGPVRMASRQYSWPQRRTSKYLLKVFEKLKIIFYLISASDGSMTVNSIKEDNE